MLRQPTKKIPLIFYRTRRGNEPVHDWISRLDSPDRLAVGQDLMLASEGFGIMSKQHHGSSLDSLLQEEGVFDETQALAVKEVVVWQLTEAMAKQSLTKARLAVLLKTSRSQVDRLLDPTRDVTLSTLQRAAALVGRKLRIELV